MIASLIEDERCSSDLQLLDLSDCLILGQSINQRGTNALLRGIMPKNLIDEVVSASPNRRSFLKTLGAATAGVTALSMAGLTPAQGQTTTEVEVLKFALNLEYLESEFYNCALYGEGIELFHIGVDGEANGSNPTGGMVTSGGKKVDFSNPNQVLTYEVVEQIGADERAHVTLLRSAL